MPMVEEESMFTAYHRALFTMHDKHERLLGLHDVHAQLPDKMFWTLFHLVWCGSESLFLHGAEIRDMLTPQRLESPDRFAVMESHELDFIKRSARRGVPLKIYRGGSALNHTGFSWTTRRAVADQFADLSGSSTPTVTIGRVPIPNVVLYVAGKESEIIAFPEHVKVEKIEDVEPIPKKARNMRQFQIVVQAKGANAVQQLTPAEYFLNAVERGDMDRAVVLDHMRTSKAFLEPLGFSSRVKTIDSVITTLEAG